MASRSSAVVAREDLVWFAVENGEFFMRLTVFGLTRLTLVPLNLNLRVRLAFHVLLLVLFASPCLSQEATPESKMDAKYRDDMLGMAKSYTFELNDKSVAQFIERPLFSWSNPQRSSEGGVVLLWMKQGRPVATMGIWRMPNPGVANGYEIQSLSEETFKASSDSMGTFSTTKPGVVFAQVIDAPKPAIDARSRLNQMRQIAKQNFSADLDPGTGQQEVLRLISTPIYRYEERPEGVIDGAIFSFAQGTDPEVLLMLEARSNGSDAAWFYAMAPSTSHGVAGSCNGAVVLRRERLSPTYIGNNYMVRLLTDTEMKKGIKSR